MSDAAKVFLAGKLVDGSEVKPVRAPFDGRVLSDVHRGDGALIERALDQGARAAPKMASLRGHERKALLRKIADGLRAARDDVATTLCDEAGKPMRYAKSEVDRGIQTFEFAAEHAANLGDEAIPLDAVAAGAGRYGVVRRFPIGLVAAVSPFNFPLNLVAHKLAPAFAAGCPVVLKPASQTPLTALKLATICQEAGLPEGGLSVVPSSREAADVLTTNPRVKLLSFTGSPSVGWGMKARAGKKRVVLELGGNAAAIVHGDADVQLAVERIAAGAFAYAGQVCISVQRVLVHASLYGAFREAFVAHVKAKVGVGDPRRDDVDVGPMIDDDNAARIVAWLEEAKAAGALVEGGAREGRVVAPAILERVPRSAKVSCEEAFGPVVTLAKYDDVDDAIAQVNDSAFGLQAGVFTDSTRALWRFYEGLEVGGVIHNDAPIFRVDNMPYGGVKDSGFGREGLPTALADYTEQRLLALRPSP